MKCSKINCPVQYNVDNNGITECKLSSIDECPYYTPEIDYKLLYEYTCNHIADLVVMKLKNYENKPKENND